MACRRLVGVLFLVAAASCSAAADDAAAGPEKVVRISGSGTASPIVERLAEEYAGWNPGVSFDFGVGTNTGGGIRGVHEGTLDLAVANRPLTEEEASSGVGYHPFARDAMVFAVHLPNTAFSLSSDQVRALYAGEATDWSDVGGDPQPVILLGRDPDESATKLLLVPFMKGLEVSPSVIILDRSTEMLDALQTTSGAIGFTSLGLLRLEGIESVAPVELDGVEPSPRSLDDGSYPWMMTFALVSPPGGASGAAEDFLSFVTSADARPILERYGYASVGE